MSEAEAMIRKAIARIKQCPATPPDTLFTNGYMVARNPATDEVTITNLETGAQATDEEVDWLCGIYGVECAE